VIGRFHGPIEFGRPGAGSNMIMWQLCWKPRPGVTTPDETPVEWVTAAALPALSTTETWVVSSGPPVATGPSRASSPRSIRARCSAA
jgi:hypothetical protein